MQIYADFLRIFIYFPYPYLLPCEGVSAGGINSLTNQYRL